MRPALEHLARRLPDCYLAICSTTHSRSSLLACGGGGAAVIATVDIAHRVLLDRRTFDRSGVGVTVREMGKDIF